MYIVRLISFFKQFKNESDYSNAIIDGRLKKHIDTIPEILQDLLSNYQWEKVEDYLKNSKDYNLDPIDIISSEQNIEILANAEEYFRKMVLEPPGSQASWNTRDQHMLMTIMRINRFQQICRYPPKIIGGLIVISEILMQLTEVVKTLLKITSESVRWFQKHFPTIIL